MIIFKLRLQKVDPTVTKPSEPPSKHWFTRAHIRVATHSTDADGSILLTPDCRTTGEVVTWADTMIKELEGIKREATRVDWNG
jgi:hypothetical protein